MRAFLSSHGLAIALIVVSIIASGEAYLGGLYLLDEAALRDAAVSRAAQDSLIQGLHNSMASSSAENARLAAENMSLSDDLSRTLAAQADIQSKISGIKGGLDYIQKERANDPQLLQKYSRVYFLNENYAPAALLRIDPAFSYPSTTVREFHAQALPFLARLLAGADSAGIHLRVLSSFRSFYDQADLKQAYKIKYGSGSNSFSADQGYSEHQLGTAIDFTTAETKVLSGFDATKAYPWLAANAYQYGFILSYPKGNSFYIYEPWHWRFVGVALATKLHELNQHFYDMDQRQIDAYRATMFDQ